MSRQRIVCGAVLAVAFSAGLAACGGSSSETPRPLQPDPQGFHYAPPPPVTSDDSDAGDAPRNVNGADDDKPRGKASSTWGAGRAPTPH
jgi:hypothetical protein